MSTQRLDGRVFIVTGGGRGLGEATAVELGRYGATVVVNDLGVSLSGDDESTDPAETTVEAVQTAGGEATVHRGDVSSFEYTSDLVADTVEQYGRLDGIVNYAGILRDTISYKMDPKDFDAVVRVHLRGHFCLLRNAAAHWRERARETDNDELASQRSFVSVVSPAIWGNPGQLNYASAKAGVLGMTRTAAIELSRFNVRVNALMPLGFTRMIEAIPEDKREFSPDDIPPEKVAPVAAYLLSDEATDITGCTVRAAGNEISLVSNPEIVRRGYDTDGWSLDDLAEHFKSDIARGIDLDRSTREF
jgi:NAD(P)-dependent dehydrogenase (short-subunit alcohol dehydrogenase family)